MTGAIYSLLRVRAINCITSHTFSQKNDKKRRKCRAGQLSSGHLVRGNRPVKLAFKGVINVPQT